MNTKTSPIALADASQMLQAGPDTPGRRRMLVGLLGAATMLGGAKAIAADLATGGKTGGDELAAIRRIDVHAHYVPERYRKEAVAAGHAKPDGMPGLPKWSAQSAIEQMDRYDIGAALLSISSPGVHFGDDSAARLLARSVNEDGARAVQDYPKRFGLFATLPLPDIDGALAEIAYAFDTLKADGVVMLTNQHGMYLGDARLDPVFAELNRRGATIFIHPTSPTCPCCNNQTQGLALPYPRPMMEFVFDTTRAVINMILSGTLDKYPRIRIIVPHAGAALPVLADRVTGLSPALGLAKPLDTEHVFEQLRGLYYDLAGFPVPRLLSTLLQIADPKHILYGSDTPFTPDPLVGALSKKINTTPLLTPQMHKDFLRENALNLFPRFR